MDKFIRTFITVEKSIQIVAVVGVILFWGYLGLTSYQSQRPSSVPSILPTSQK
jgi:hypothetical protein